MKTSWLGPRPVTASSSVSRRATRMYGSRLATAAPRLPPPAPATEQEIRNPRPGHIPTPPRPRPDRARPALPQELAATFLSAGNADKVGVFEISKARGQLRRSRLEPLQSNPCLIVSDKLA